MVHAVLAGITRSLMFHTSLTNSNPANLVTPNPLRRVFVFILVDRFTQVLFFRGSACDRGGNRYQGFLLSFNFVWLSFAWFN